MRRSRTRLEGFLFWWLLANLFLVATVTVLAVILPSDLVKITAASSSLTLGWIGLILVVGLWVYLAWKMRAPSSGTLLFGALFFLFAVLHLEGRGWLWSLNPVLAFRAALVTRPSLTVKLDLVALVTSILFFFAWRRRVAGGEGAGVEEGYRLQG